jgi:very-short-patch-repair endonuclease/Fe-S cluster biogenesis protein NfuA
MRKLNIQDFIKRASNIHKNKYDYSQSVFNGVNKKIKIICKIHGIFEQTAKSHMNGHGCSKCSSKESSIRYTNKKKINILSNDIIIYRLKSYFINYDYSNTVIEGIRENAMIYNIVCPYGHTFNKRLNNHLYCKQGCSECSSNKLTTESFIEKLNKIHLNSYDYSEVNYINNKTKVKIICKVHGIFNQSPIKHLSGSGCPVCNNTNISKGEKYIYKYLTENKIDFEYQKRMGDTLQVFDFYVESLNLVIEYDSIQHFEPREFFGGELNFKDQLRRDFIKNKYCADNKISIKRISYKNLTKLKEILDDIFIRDIPFINI